MNILFYSPFDQRSRDTESLMLAFRDQGHHVISLSQTEGKYIHAYLKTQQIETVSYILTSNGRLFFYLKHVIFLVRFCRKRKIDIVYSHLESSNFVAVIAKFFISAILYINRHHIDEAALQGFDKSFFYRLTYSLAQKIIVVSDQAARYMSKVEGIKNSKIIKINLAYDFSLYDKPDRIKVDAIRRNTSHEVILLTVCRLTKFKRVDLSVELLKSLLKSGINAKLIILGRGEEEQHLRHIIGEASINNNVFMPGHVNNVTDYLAASDFLIHPSVLESSCVIVKEAGITEKPVIVCEKVGDFDDYMENDINGFITPQNDFVNCATSIILSNYQNKKKLETIGRNLHRSVLELFSVENVIGQYDSLNIKR